MAFSLSLGSRGLRASFLAAGVALSQTIALVMLTGCASQTGQITQVVVEVLPAAQMVPTKLGRLAVRDSGPADATGDVLVLWHAVLTDHRIYQAQIEAWRGRHRLIVIHGPGHGGSQAAPGPFSMADCATALAETLDALNITQPVVIVGTSWGGLVGGEFALAYPARTRALVMLNTPINAPAEGLNFSDRFVVWGARWIHASSLYRDGVARAFFLPTTRAQGGPVIQAFHDHLRQADGPALALSVGSVLLEREALAPRMGGIRAPVLFIVGAEDNMYPPQTLRPAVAQLPQGRFEVVPSAHISVVDAPEPTTRLINEFLARLPNRR